MATLLELAEAEKLALIEVPLDPDEMSWRRIYGTPDFVVWLENDLEHIPSTVLGVQLSPLEQIFSRFHEYITGEPLNDDRRFKWLVCNPDQFVWELKTDDVRVFGWVPCKDCLVLCFGDGKDRIETLKLYGRYIAQTAYTRNNMELDAPKCVTSKDYNDVISNKNL